MYGLTAFLRIFEGADDFWIVQYGAVFDSLVDFYKILIDHAAGADVEVAYFGVAHLSVGKTYVFTAGLQLGMRVVFKKIVPIGSWGGVDGVGCAVCAYAPSVENDQKCFFSHIKGYFVGCCCLQYRQGARGEAVHGA